MSSAQPIGSVFQSLLAADADDEGPVAEEALRDRLVAGGFVPTPICVIGSVEDGERRVEIFEEQARTPGHPQRFLVRLVVRGECEHAATLADLPDLLEHFDRLVPLFTRLAGGVGRRARAALPSAARRRSRA